MSKQHPQIFSIDVHHENAFSTAGCECFREDDPRAANWLELGRLKSLEWPGLAVHCQTWARIRRIYKDGAIVKDWPEWPYSGAVPDGDVW